MVNRGEAKPGESDKNVACDILGAGGVGDGDGDVVVVNKVSHFNIYFRAVGNVNNFCTVSNSRLIISQMVEKVNNFLKSYPIS